MRFAGILDAVTAFEDDGILQRSCRQRREMLAQAEDF